MEFVWFILIGLAAGFLATLLFRKRGLGWIWNLIIGIVGGVIGGLILRLFGITLGGMTGHLIASVLGAIILLWVFFSFTKKS